MPSRRRSGREDHVLHPVALVVEQHVFDFLELAVHRVAVERLHRQRLAIGILLARNLEFFFLGGELLDDLLLGDALRRRRVEFAFAALGGGDATRFNARMPSARKCRSDRREFIKVPVIIVFDESRGQAIPAAPPETGNATQTRQAPSLLHTAGQPEADQGIPIGVILSGGRAEQRASEVERISCFLSLRAMWFHIPARFWLGRHLRHAVSCGRFSSLRYTFLHHPFPLP